MERDISRSLLIPTIIRVDHSRLIFLNLYNLLGDEMESETGRCYGDTAPVIGRMHDVPSRKDVCMVQISLADNRFSHLLKTNEASLISYHHCYN